MEKIEEILKTIRQGESEHLEFKSTLSEWKRAVQTLAALAWTGGGRVVFGVSKSGKIVGVDMGKGTVEKRANDVKINTDPRIYPKIYVEKVEGKNIILVEVEKVSEHGFEQAIPRSSDVGRIACLEETKSDGG